jgi:hypothetical protein
MSDGCVRGGKLRELVIILHGCRFIVALLTSRHRIVTASSSGLVTMAIERDDREDE